MSDTRVRLAVVAGEASGDQLGAAVLSQLRRKWPDLQVEGVGGEAMMAEGLQSLYPMERLSVMGLTEPLRRLPELLRMRARLVRRWLAAPPDLFLGIDAPDFNLPLAVRLRREGIRTAHLVSPSLWAWRRGRIHTVAKAVDLMLTLFPFEIPVYREHGVPAVHVGHPMADQIVATPDTRCARRRLGLPEEGRVLALLPGSRASEIRLLAPRFLQAADRLAQHTALQLVIPAANESRHTELAQILSESRFSHLRVTLLRGQLTEAVTAADAVLVASGTASLEVMLLGRPMVIAYALSPLSYGLLSRLVHTPWVGLPNILAGQAVVPELLQSAATPAALAAALAPLLCDSDARDAQLGVFAVLASSLRVGAAQRAATALAELLEHR